MIIKKIKWVDNVTEHGKKSGMFDIISETPLDAWISISNKSYLNENLEGGYMLSFRYQDERETRIVMPTIEDAKVKAQELFEEEIMDLFFDIEDYDL